jgi:RNA polymerase sigma factor (sigma-70 family)
MSSVLRHLTRAALRGLPDGQLLERFLSRHEEAAFEALVRRHGPMVLGVCRRVLGSLHDAEDAFQATFLVLVRKAASLRSRELLGNWLYGVAYRTAMKARTMNARRRAREERARVKPAVDRPTEDGWEELLPLLDQELSQLPDKYRVPVVLCDLEGRSRREVARDLKVPEGTVSSRLATARKLLAGRLARYGVALSGGALAAVLTGKAASACVSGALAASTARVAVLAAGEGFTAGAVPAQVLALTEGVVKTMFLMKLRAVVAVALVVCVGAGVVGLAYRTGAEEPKQPAGLSEAAPTAKRPVAVDAGWQADELEALRLEIGALRKELRATQERVRVLEDQVASPKGTKTGAGPAPEKPDPARVKQALEREMQANKLAEKLRALSAAQLKRKEAADPLAEAEAALRKLRQDPSDSKAADALERALQRLKERAKPEGKPETPAKP